MRLYKGVNGDFLGGSNLAETFEGRNIVELLNEMSVDAVVIGNHEFDFGADGLQKRINESKFPYLGANIKDTATNTLWTPAKDILLQKFTIQRHDIYQQPQQPSSLHSHTIPIPAPLPSHTSSYTSSYTSTLSVPRTTESLSSTIDIPLMVPSPMLSPSPAICPSHAVTFPDEIAITAAFFGVVTAATPTLSWPGPSVSFDPVIPTVANCIQKLSAYQPDVTIGKIN